MTREKTMEVFFFPMLAQGHMLPLLDMAKLFSSTTTSGGAAIKSTIITTPLNSVAISNSIRASKHSPTLIDIQIIEFPRSAGVPDGIESLDQCITNEMIDSLIGALSQSQEPLERLLGDLRPDCIVADMFYPWATDSAAKFDIPRLAFNGSSFFVMCAVRSMYLYKPFMNVASDSEPFVLPALPHEIKLTRYQISREEREHISPKLPIQSKDPDLHCYGVIVNSFYDLEADYVNQFRSVYKEEAWHIGPLLLYNKRMGDQLVRGKKPDIDENECLKWLDYQKPNSVIYVCFGSETYLSSLQLYELAMGLKASEQPFIWVVRRRKDGEQKENDEWMPEGFEEQTKGKGLIIRGWAPQVLILEHEAVGGFVTHCGWNSILESICSGVPMVTWPGFADQFYNEKLVTEILRIGVSVGDKEWTRIGSRVESEGIKSEQVERGVKMIIMDKQGKEMRGRVKELQERANKAVEKGGSSYNDFSSLVEDLYSLKSSIRKSN